MSRRSVVAAAAWGVPAVSLASATPAFANTSQATNVTISGPSGGVPASGAVPVTVTVKDAQGQPQAGQPVSFSGPDGSSFDAADGVTNGAGQYTAKFNNNKPWAKPGSTIAVTAVSGSGNASQSFAVLGSNVLGWGSGTSGVTGLGNSANTSTPSQLSQTFPAPVVQVAQGGDYFTLFRLADGTVWGVGRNSQGQLANGTTNDASSPQRVQGLSDVVDIAAGYQTGYAVLQDGTVRSWGVNYESALGDGTTYSNKSFSTSVVTVRGVSNAIKVAGGSWFGLALLSDGTVAGWGRNGFGQLGDTTNGNRTTATKAVGVSNVTEIAATSVAGYALRSDGTIMAWGGNWKGQQGDGSTTSGNRYTPATVSGISTATSVAAAGQTGYALLADKTVVAWGDGEAGELGNGASAASPTPVAVQGLTNVVQIGAGYALTDSGAVYAWGANDSGQLGNGNNGSGSNVPVAVTLPAGVPLQAIGGSMGGPARYVITGELTVNVDVVQDQVAAGSAGTVQARVSSGSAGIGGAEVSLTATGNAVLGSTLGQTNGNGDVATTVTPDQWTMPGTQVTVRASTDAAVSSDSFTVLGANALGSGGDRRGALGVLFPGTFDGPTSIPTPTQLTPVFQSPIKQFASCGHSTLVLLQDGTVWGVGENGYQQVRGAAGLVGEWTPLPGLTNAKQIALGDYSGAALLEDGSVFAWGTGGYGGLGDNSGYGAVWTAPQRVNELSGVRSIGAGMGTIYALMDDGSVRVCGWGELGQIGDGGTNDVFTFKTVPNFGGVSSLAVVAVGAYALKSDRTVWYWGYGGQTVPTQVPNLSNVKAIDGHIALLDDGSVFTLDGVAAPIAVAGLSNVVAVSGVGGSSNKSWWALSNDGTLKAWGSNGGGQLGDGTTTDRTSPVVLTSLAGHVVSAVSTSVRNDRAFFITSSSVVSVDVADPQVTAGVASAVVAKVAAGSAAVPGAAVSLTATHNAVVATPTGTTGTSGEFQTTVTPDLWTTPGDVVRVTAASGASSAQDTFRTLGANVAGAGGWLGLGVEIGYYGNSPTPVQLRREFTSPVVAMASNGNSGLALLKDGTVWGMGGNFYRTLADIDDSVYAWTQIPGVANAVQVTITDYTAYALRADGTVLAWGTGEYDLFPPVNGKAAVWHTPTVLSDLTGVRQIAAGYGTFYAVMSDGTVKANGWGEVGQFGNGGTTNSSAFVTVPTLSGVVSIGTSAVAATALKGDGTVWYWGEGPNNTQIAPTKIPNLSNIKNVSSNVALAGDGTVWQFDYANAATQVSGLSNVSSVASQGASFYALLPDGSAKAWGVNKSGQLGDGTQTDRTSPVDVTGFGGRVVTGVFPCIRGGKAHFVTGSGIVSLTVATPIAAGSAGAVTAKVMAGSTPVAGAALTLAASGGAALAATSGQSDSSGQVQTTVTPDTWTRPGASLSVTAASGSSSATQRFIVTGSNLLHTGYGLWGAGGDGTWNNASSATQTLRSFPSPVVQAFAGGISGVALLADGSVWTVGRNDYGQLGDPSIPVFDYTSDAAARSTWGRLSGLPGNIVQITGGLATVYALTSTGDVYAWGWNYNGQIGDGTTTDRTGPVKVPGLTGVKRLGGGSLGDGTTTQRLSPIALPAWGTVLDIGGDHQQTAALRTDGTVWTCSAVSGTLGNGNGATSASPVQVSGLSNVQALGFGFGFFHALKADGTVVGWGVNDVGQIGNGGTSTVLSPTAVSGLSGVTKLGARWGGSYALLGNGQVWGWGRNDLAQLGDGSTTNRLTPVQMTGLESHTVSRVDAGIAAQGSFLVV